MQHTMGVALTKNCWGLGAKAGGRCSCCPGCPIEGLKTHSPLGVSDMLANGHLVWGSCWCVGCRLCCSEKAVTEAVVNRKLTAALLPVFVRV